jgi:carbonic anhydrase
MAAMTLAAAALGEGAHWGYSGEAGPGNWGRLDPSYAVCASGKNQSPVDLASFVEADLKPIARAVLK